MNKKYLYSGLVGALLLTIVVTAFGFNAIETVWKGIGTTYIKGQNRIIKVAHDDAGWTELGTGEKRFYMLATAVTSGVTTTSAPAGSFAWTSNATGKNQQFRSDGTYWVEMARSPSSFAGHESLGAI